MNQPQYMDALDRANEIRLARAETKQQVFRGETSIKDALALECCQGMKVIQLLMAQWWWGRERALNALTAWRISEDRSVSSLTERQRTLIAEACESEQEAER